MLSFCGISPRAYRLKASNAALLFSTFLGTSRYLALHTNPPGGLAKYYRDNVVGGPGAFVLPIDDFGNFGDAMIRKLTAEIAANN